jgi:hypothetical protein
MRIKTEQDRAEQERLRLSATSKNEISARVQAAILRRPVNELHASIFKDFKLGVREKVAERISGVERATRAQTTKDREQKLAKLQARLTRTFNAIALN